MKKRFAIILICVLLFAATFGVLAGCTDSRLQFYAPDGAPLMAVAELFSEKPALGEKEVNYVVTTGENISGALDGLTPPDIALAPVNLCDKVIKRGDYVFAGVAVWGLLHIMANTENGGAENVTLAEIAAAGDILYAYQPAATTGLILERIIKDGGLQVNVVDGQNPAKTGFVNIVYLENNPAAVAALVGDMKQVEGAKYAVIAEPVATQLETGGKIVRAFDLQEEWQNLYGENCPQVGVVVKKTVAEESPEVFAAIKEALKNASKFTREKAARVAEIMKDELGSSYLPQKPAIESFIKGKGQSVFLYQDEDESKAAVENYLAKLYAGL